MSTTPFGSEQDAVDVVGVGFGPSNVALAIAIEEHNTDGAAPLTARFLERQARFGWHRGMLLDDATMQVSFLKDLVTMRNPTSDFSFLAYLHDRDRLVDFINHKILFPLRIEFHDYLEWAATELARVVDYDAEVVDARPVFEDGCVVSFDVTARSHDDGTLRRVHARNLSVAVGLEAKVPPGIELGPRVWHTIDLLDRLADFPTTPTPACFVVVGAGQSAAEAVGHLHRRFPDAQVHSVFGRYGYAPSDDSPYANRIFDPEAVDMYFDADEGVKRMLFDYHRNTNYSVVDAELIEDLYRREYQERVLGSRRLHMMNASRVEHVHEHDDVALVDVVSLPTGERTVVRADAVVLATGYRPADPARFLGSVGDLVRRRPDGAPEVTRDYRLVLDAPAKAAVYVQGGTEHTHGISSTLLSNVAVRTGEIVDSIVAASTLPAWGNGTPDVVAAAG